MKQKDKVEDSSGGREAPSLEKLVKRKKENSSIDSLLKSTRAVQSEAEKVIDEYEGECSDCFSTE